MDPKLRFETVDQYISACPEKTGKRLKELRKTIKEAAPEAVEKISYNMPAFTYKGMLLYYAAHTNHIGFYPLTTAIAAFKKELKEYNCSKGTVQFPNDEPLPLELISRMVKFRVEENNLKALQKSGKKTAKKTEKK